MKVECQDPRSGDCGRVGRRAGRQDRAGRSGAARAAYPGRWPVDPGHDPRALHVQRRPARLAAAATDRSREARGASRWSDSPRILSDTMSATGFLNFFTPVTRSESAMRGAQGLGTRSMPTEQRIDFYPTHQHADYQLRPASPILSGPPWCRAASTSRSSPGMPRSCTLVLCSKRRREPMAEIPFPEEFRIGNVVHDDRLRPGLRKHRIRLPHGRAVRPERRPPLRSIARSCCDPYARVIGGRDVWGEPPDWNDIYQHRARLAFDDFDWEGDRAAGDLRSRIWSSTRCTCAASRGTRPRGSSMPGPSPASARRSPT